MITKIIKPKRLKRGDRVRIIAPSSPFREKDLLRGVEKLEKMGLEVVYRKDIFSKEDYLAGSDKRRLAEVEQAFRDKKCKAIFCARGGFGSTRLLKNLDYRLIKRNPKIFVGFSDTTALSLAFFRKTGLVTFHGPVVASRKFLGMSVREERYFRKALFSDEPLIYSGLGIRSLVRGKARGRLIGANLSLIHALAATPYEPVFKDHIVFFEDTEEHPYKIDRILGHLFELGMFDKIRGLVVGRFAVNKRKYSGIEQRLLIKIIRNYFGPLRIPILFNFPLGHLSGNYVLPNGGTVLLDAAERKLICEGACE